MCVPRKGYAREGPRHAVPSAWDSPSNRGMVRVGCTRRALRVGPLDGKVSAWEIWCVLYKSFPIAYLRAPNAESNDKSNKLVVVFHILHQHVKSLLIKRKEEI